MQFSVLWSSRRLGTVIGLIALGVLSGRVTAQVQQKNADEITASTGIQVYKQARCYACHGEQGFGGVGPSFRQDRFLAIGDYVIAQILLGRGIMPSFAEALNDEQIAAVATYIRDSWGNGFGDVKADEVAIIRKQLSTEKTPQQPHVSASGQPRQAPAPPSGGQPPGQPLPPPNMR